MVQSRKTRNPKFGKRNSAVSFAPVGVVGLGYVGLPVACAFAKHLSPPKSGGAAVIGFDLNPERIDLLRLGRDETGEVTSRDLRNPRLEFTADPRRLRDCRYILVTVPTPINEANEPDLGPLRRASEIVGKNLSAGATVIYESTVYPGVTEEFCLPILEKFSGLKLGDFKIGYSPERINPGDQQHTLDKIIKVVSACDAETLDRVVALYSLVAKSGVHRPPNIKTAEAAKVIENVQRADLNSLEEAHAYQRLHEESNVLKARLVGVEEPTAQHMRLERLLAFKRNLVYSSVTASVIGRDPSGWSSSMIIDRGRGAGIRQGMPAINALGVVGKITEVSEQDSKVVLLTDPQFSVAAVVQGSREIGLVTGSLQGEICRMRFISSDAQINVGDKVITSRLSTSFPEGLLIGEVVRIIRNPQEPSIECIIKPVVVLSQVEEVLVILSVDQSRYDVETGSGFRPPGEK